MQAPRSWPRTHRRAAAAFLSLAVLLLAGLQLPTSAAHDKPDDKAKVAPAELHLLERVALIGASVTAGFGIESEHDLADAFEAACVGRRTPPLSEGDALFFLQPGPSGRTQVEKALRHKPTLVIAIDFLFWYGFGTVNAEGGELTNEEDRLALLEKGLELLARFEVPVVVGDFPDVRDAVGRVLMPQQVPSEEIRAQLNARLREWVGKHERVRLVSLDGALVAMHKRGKLQLCGGELDLKQSELWLQPDRLHATPAGLALLVQLIAESLRSGGATLDKDVWLCDVEAVRKRMLGE